VKFMEKLGAKVDMKAEDIARARTSRGSGT